MKHHATHGMNTLLMPGGVKQKSRMTVEFLQIKVQEYERLRAEIEELSREAGQETAPGEW